MSNPVVNEVCSKCKYTVERAKDWYLYYKNFYDGASRYTRTIISLGYASIFSILAFTHKEISGQSLIGVSFFLLLSIFLFVLDEVWDMALNRERQAKMDVKWRKFIDKEIDFFELHRQDAKNLPEKIYGFYSDIFGLWVCAITGFCAAGILLCDYWVYLNIGSFLHSYIVYFKNLF